MAGTVSTSAHGRGAGWRAGALERGVRPPKTRSTSEMEALMNRPRFRFDGGEKTATTRLRSLKSDVRRLGNPTEGPQPSPLLRLRGIGPSSRLGDRGTRVGQLPLAQAHGGKPVDQGRGSICSLSAGAWATAPRASRWTSTATCCLGSSGTRRRPWTTCWRERSEDGHKMATNAKAPDHHQGPLHSLLAGAPKEIRTPVSTLKGWRPGPLDDGGGRWSSIPTGAPAVIGCVPR